MNKKWLCCQCDELKGWGAQHQVEYYLDYFAVDLFVVIVKVDIFEYAVLENILKCVNYVQLCSN